MIKDTKLAVLIDGDNIPSRYIQEMMEEIIDSKSKTTEKRTQDIYTSNNNKVLFKDHSLLLTGGNKVRLVNFHALDLEIQWAVPYYNQYTDELDFVAWNEDRDYPSKVIVIVNDNKLFDYIILFSSTAHYYFHLLLK